MDTPSPPQRYLPTPYGSDIPACYIRDVHDVVAILNARQAGLVPECTRRLKDPEKQTYIVSGWWVIFPVDVCGVTRWTDHYKWSPSRVQGLFFVYRQLDASRSRQSRKLRAHPYNRAARDARLTLAQCRAQRANSSSATDDDDEWAVLEFDRTIVSSWTDNSAFTRNGVCKKTFALFLGEREYRIISYYNPKDVHNGLLRPAAEVPQYAMLPTDPAMLAMAKYRKTNKREQCIGFVADLLDPRNVNARLERFPRVDQISTSVSYLSTSDSERTSSPSTSYSSLSPTSLTSPTFLASPGSSTVYAPGPSDLHWMPLEPPQSSHASLMPRAHHQQYFAGSLSAERDVDDGGVVQRISRLSLGRALPIQPPRAQLPTPASSPIASHPQSQPWQPDTYVYELSRALMHEEAAQQPAHVPLAPYAQLNTSLSYAPSMHAMSQPLYAFPPSPPQTVSDNTSYLAYYPMPSDFTPLGAAEPLDLSFVQDPGMYTVQAPPHAF